MKAPEPWKLKENEAWELFAYEFNRLAVAARYAPSTDRKKRSFTSLAKEIGVTDSQLKYYRLGRVKPGLTLFPKLAEVLRAGANDERSHDPLYFLDLMGLVPKPRSTELQDRLVDVAYRLHKLQLKFAQAQDEAGTYGRRGGSAAVVKASLASERWGVAVWPAFEGPKDCRMKVADRIDFTRLDAKDSTPLTADEVWADPLIRKALRSAYAIRTKRRPRWADFTQRPTSQWSIPHIGSPMAPLVEKPYLGAPSISLSSITNASWVNDVASLLALIIGYGLSTTRDLAMDIGDLSPEAITNQQTLMVHGRWLQNPPQRRCWSHHSTLTREWDNPFSYPGKPQAQGVLHIWIEEDDALLHRWATFTPPNGLSRPSVMTLIAEKKHILAYLKDSEASQPVVHIKAQNRQQPDERWEQVLHTVKDILNICIDRGLLPANLSYAHTLALTRDQGLVHVVSNWLTSHGCKAVFDVPSSKADRKVSTRTKT